MDTPNCACHDQPGYWQKDDRLKAGGFVECAVKRRERERARYDHDWRYRIDKNLKSNARKRRESIERRRALDGTLPGQR